MKNNPFENFVHRFGTFEKLLCSFKFPLLSNLTIIAVDPYRLPSAS